MLDTIHRFYWKILNDLQQYRTEELSETSSEVIMQSWSFMQSNHAKLVIYEVATIFSLSFSLRLFISMHSKQIVINLLKEFNQESNKYVNFVEINTSNEYIK